MLYNPGSKYETVLRKVISDIQVMIYRREHTPIRDRNEVALDLNLRIRNMHKAEKVEWRRSMIELAAYAVFAVVADQSDEKTHG